jgi:hypothetical protein
MQAILSQIPRIPSVGNMSVSRLVKRSPEEALGIVCDNVPTVFGPKARVVTLDLLDDMTPPDGRAIDVYYLVVEDVTCDLDGDDSMPMLKRMRTETEYKKATLRRIMPDESVRMEWLDEDVSGTLAFEPAGVFEDKISRGYLIEMTDDVGTFVLDASEGGDFFFFHPHEPLVVTFVNV